MTALVFGIGIGLFAVLVLWITAALVFAVSLRTEKRVGAIAVAVAIAITVILIGLPRRSEDPTFREDKPYDRIFVWRVILLVLLVVSSIAALLGYIKYTLLEAIRPRRITDWIY